MKRLRARLSGLRAQALNPPPCPYPRAARAQVVVAQVDAHELFRAAAAAAGVVVLVRQVVLPDALGAALRNHKALDDVD